MGTKIAVLRVGLQADAGKFSTRMTAAATKVRTFNQSVLGAGRGVGAFSGKLAGLAGVSIGTAAAIGALHRSFDRLDSLAKKSDALGIATEKLAGFHLAADLTGVGVDVIDKALERMNRSVSEASTGLGTARYGLDALGLSAERLKQLSPDRQFTTIAGAISKVALQSDRARIAYQIFGRQGTALLNTLALGEKGLNDIAAETERYGTAISRVDAAKVEAANDSWRRTQEIFSGLIDQIAVQLSPYIVEMNTEFQNWATSGVGASERVSRGLQTVEKWLSRIAIVTDAIDASLDGLGATFNAVLGLGLGGIDKAVDSYLGAINRVTKWLNFPGTDEHSMLSRDPKKDKLKAAVDALFSSSEEMFGESGGKFKDLYEQLEGNGGGSAKRVEDFFERVKKRSEDMAKAVAANSRVSTASYDDMAGATKDAEKQQERLGDSVDKTADAVEKAQRSVGTASGSKRRAAFGLVEHTPGKSEDGTNPLSPLSEAKQMAAMSESGPVGVQRLGREVQQVEDKTVAELIRELIRVSGYGGAGAALG